MSQATSLTTGLAGGENGGPQNGSFHAAAYGSGLYEISC
eukprot:CAMPEP_0175583998 /NCGR_PEP_ID=MMETSP0096-20121207/48954_1 /TAXON_ID=311494 /ORGANISM="Alexandrium monilatum, Strain CCMP3105" /LENGTH=38 /DNA_ID= /DNA_START= /DNA_END= /DNA_ORIENTATION=